jgi:16S rRNA U516 pseudouridylate synthase RsuA-like enzyme
MFGVLGYYIKKLHRVEYGNLKLGSLEEGKWRYLNQKEIESFKSLTSRN